MHEQRVVDEPEIDASPSEEGGAGRVAVGVGERPRSPDEHTDGSGGVGPVAELGSRRLEHLRRSVWIHQRS